MIDRSPPDVSICIPTLQGYENLHALLLSIKANTTLNYEVVIVDCGNRVRGYPIPMNQAMRAARGRVIVGLNDDVEVTPGWLEPLVHAVEQGAWMASPDMTEVEGNQCYTGWCVAFDRAALYGDSHGIYGETLHGAGLWYDEQFGIWCTDVDLAKRLTVAGHPAVRVAIPNLLRHKGSETGTRPEVSEVLRDEQLHDLDRYQAKWGESALKDKFALAPPTP